MANKCPGCAGSLLFSPSRQAMYCKICGGTYTPEEIDSRADEMMDCSIYTCEHCGGEIVLNGTEVSSVCVFCGSPSIAFSRIAKGRRPDGVLPFQVSKDEALNIISIHVKNARFAPESLKTINRDNIRGIYVPYKVISSDFYDAGWYTSSVKEYGQKNRITYGWGRAGTTIFYNVPFDASMSLNDEFSQRLEPFYFDDIKDFDESYLSGFYSDMSDMTTSDLKEAALKRFDEMFNEYTLEFIDGKDKKIIDTKPSMRINDEILYLMLPCWFYTYMHNGKAHTILVNGQTGKAVGIIPWDKKRMALITAAIFIPVLAASLLPYFLMGAVGQIMIGTHLVMGMIFAGIPLITAALVRIRKLKNSGSLSTSPSVFRYVKKRQA